MEKYTMEDVELLRKKSGMSYQDAVKLLEYHNGNLAKALIDLEKNGRLQERKSRTAACETAEGKGNFRAFIRKMYRNRVKIHKGDTTVVNLSVLYAVPCLLCAPHITVFGVIAAMVLGYRFSFSQMDEDFATAAVSLKKPEKADAAGASAADAKTAAELSAQLSAEANALAEKEIPTIQIPVQTVC